MLITKTLPDGRKRHKLKTLLFKPKDAYVRPKLDFKTSTSIWNIDEFIKKRVQEWRRLTQEDGHTGLRSILRKDTVYTGTYSVFPIPLVEYILLRYGGEPGGKVLDAFAGGPPRAIGSALMGMEYHGVEIRHEQIEENKKVLEGLNLEGINYYLDDARFMQSLKGQFDIGMTCPPYYDVETYSQHPDDLSNFISYGQFNFAMMQNALAYYDLIKPDAFVCIIVGNFRDKKSGALIDFRGDTVDNFREAGFVFWEDVILSRNFGSAAKRAKNAWSGRKLVRRHEHLLVFWKPK